MSPIRKRRLQAPDFVPFPSSFVTAPNTAATLFLLARHVRTLELEVVMRRAKAISYTAAIMLGCMMFLVGLINMVKPDFGMTFLQAVGSLDPGFYVTHTFGSVMIGTIYGVLQGLIVGCIFGLVYDVMMRSQSHAV